MIKVNRAKFERSLDKKFATLLKPDNLFAGWANREFQKLYGENQKARWMSEGASEGRSWKPLNQRYALRKRIDYADEPGRGTKMLIATGRLFAGVMPPEQRGAFRGNAEEFRKVVEKKSVRIATTVPYAKFVSEEREFSVFSSKTRITWARSYKSYLIRGIIGGKKR